MHLSQLRGPRWRLDGFCFYLSQEGSVFWTLKTRKTRDVNTGLPSSTASEYLHNDLARAIKALEQNKMHLHCDLAVMSAWSVLLFARSYLNSSAHKLPAATEHVLYGVTFCWLFGFWVAVWFGFA